MPNGKFINHLFGIFLIFLSSFLLMEERSASAASNRNKAHSSTTYTVVLDPGHGGHDNGASTRLGPKKKHVYEKDLTLALALRTKRLLENPLYSDALDGKIKVILTRKDNRYVSLEKRSEIAQKNSANLFLSIHTNSDLSSKAKGLEVYFLNNTDKESYSKLEQIENRHSKKRKNTASLLMRSIAADAIVDDSKIAAENIHQSIVGTLNRENLSFEDRGVRQAMLYVLLDAQVPAVLLEAFFISNPSDLNLLMQPDSRDKVAEGIAKGILRFLAVQ